MQGIFIYNKTKIIKKFIQNHIQKFCENKLQTTEDLHRIIEIFRKKNIIKSHSSRIINATLQTANLSVRDVMVPSSQMTTIATNSNFDDFLKIITTSSHSRFPIVDDNNKIKGILLAKDLLNFMASDSEKFNYNDYLRQAIIIPENKSIDSLLEFFQMKKTHMMIVVDEYFEVSGLITLEDVLEQIVGEIEDEYDLEEEDIIAYGNNRFLVRSSVNIDDFNSFFKTKFNNEDTDTIAGFIAQKFGYLPNQLESITINNLKFKILKSNKRQIQLLEVLKITDKK